MQYRFGRFRLSPPAREFWRDDVLEPLPRLLFDCLAYLIENRERAVGRDELVAAVWGRVDIPDAHVSQLILRLRRLLGDDGQAQHTVRTVPGFGYRWVVPVEVVADPSPSASTPAVDEGKDAETDEPAAVPVEQTPDPPTQDADLAQEVTPSPPAHASRARRWIPIGIAAALALAAGIRLWHGPADDVAGEVTADVSTDLRAKDVLMVLPFDVDAPRDAGWVRLGAMDLVGDRLRSAGLPVLPSDSAMAVLRGVKPDAGAPSPEQLDPRLGVGILVQGRAARSAQGWDVVLSGTLADGRQLRVQASDADVIVASRRAADLFLRDGFGRSAADGESASPQEDALLGRLSEAHAAMLAGNLDQARTVLTALPPAQAADPRAQIQRARLDLLGGRLAEARQDLDAVLDHGALDAHSALYGSAMSVSAKLHYRSRRFAEAERDYGNAIRVLQNAGSPDELGNALAGRAIARTVLRQLDGAAADLGQARIQLQQAGDRPGLAQVDMYFGVIEGERGRFEAALPYLSKAADTFDAFGVVERTVTSLHVLLDAQMELLQWSDALATSDRQWALRERVGDPALALLVTTRRGRVLLGLGRHREALQLAAEAQSVSNGLGSQNLRYLYDFQTELAWSLGQWKSAADAADRALASWPQEPTAKRRAYLVLLRQRSLIADGRADPAQIEPPLQLADPQPTLAMLELARAEWAAYRRNEAQAQQHYEEALKMVTEEGGPSRLVAVAASYADWLLGSGRLEQASALAGRTSVYAARDFGSALMQVAVLHRYDRRDLWKAALQQARQLAGERSIPAALTMESTARTAGAVR
ncbi:winged helix-turn-helix domain-containing protein [Dokdonella sp.]|uniref:winged helix-turn-helix domain-containing protein n=1 Tax=Dokdonella sp. TaxID=2291710 RepID=UPI001B29D597|nr:winged helix-turn-helix domain-containing protein [Dokdonella sp.]MBO9663130.1 winged helix-turn-helix domain-containing protein [Dokdonella sp.]